MRMASFLIRRIFVEVMSPRSGGSPTPPGPSGKSIAGARNQGQGRQDGRDGTYRQEGAASAEGLYRMLKGPGRKAGDDAGSQAQGNASQGCRRDRARMAAHCPGQAGPLPGVSSPGSGALPLLGPGRIG